MRKCSDARAKLINELIVDVVTMDIRPLLLYLEPGYRLPSRRHISSLLRKKHEKAIVILKDKLTQDAITVSLTSDMWTSNTIEAYMSVTANFSHTCLGNAELRIDD